MKISLRTLATGLLLTVLAVVGVVVHPSLAEAAGLDFWHVPDLQVAQDVMAADQRETDRKMDEVQQRLSLRYETLVDVAAGRISFDEGVVRFVQINRSSPAVAEWARALYPGDTDEVRAAWQLVGQLRANAHLGADAIIAAAECQLTYES